MGDDQAGRLQADAGLPGGGEVGAVSTGYLRCAGRGGEYLLSVRYPVALRRTDAANQETHIAAGSLDNVEELAPQEKWFPKQRPSWVPPLPAPLSIQALHD